MKIVNIRRWPDKPHVYAELQEDDGKLLISAMMDYIVQALGNEGNRPALEAWAYESNLYCPHCKRRTR